MKVPIEWLREYCAPDMPVEELATRLAMTGTEVDRVDHHGVRELDHFVVGRVVSAQQHPDADRLKVCVVDLGGGEQSQIVCGAPNVAAGQTVGVARPGSVMPDGTRLKKAKLRGQESNGMILAEDELGIGMDHAGTMVLDDELEAGAPLAGVLPISTDGSVNGKKCGRRRTWRSGPKIARANASSVPLRSASVMSSSTARPSIW
jgi:phenylalanyl-tRNA synthetase beta chain